MPHDSPAEMTIPSRHQDFPEWHRGRRHYAVWAVDIDTPEVRAVCAAAEAGLVPYLLDGYRRQPHITVALCGFPCPAPGLTDDYGPQDLARHLAGLRAAAIGPFALRLGTLASFTSAPYLSVEDPQGGLPRLRRALAAHQRDDGFAYQAHVTVGLYGGRYPLASLLADAAAHPRPPTPTLEVSSLSLMAYEAALIGGPLHILGRFDLRTASYLGDNGPFSAATTAETPCSARQGG